MSNKNLNDLTSKLETMRISNSSNAVGSPKHHLRLVSTPKSEPKRLAKKAKTRKVRWNNSPRRKSMKAPKKQETIRKRRAETARRVAAERKEAARSKARATAAKRKQEEEESRAKSVISGKTRSQAKKIKEQEGEMTNE